MANQCPICNNPLQENERTCKVCGYHVLDSTQSFEPVKMDGRPVEEAPAAGKDDHFALKIVRGPQTGVEFELHEGALTIGRDPRCDIFLNDMTVSREHATLEVGQDGCVLRDNNSFNGIWVNDRSTETCLLKAGDIVQIGAFCLLYRTHL